MMPDSGALGARVRRLERGLVQLELADRRAVRNHLDSIHYCVVTVPEVRENTDFDVHAEIRDAANEPVSHVTVRWRLSPVPSPA